MNDERLRNIELDFTEFKASVQSALESARRREQLLEKAMKEMQTTIQSVRIDATRMATSAENTEEILVEHTAQDMAVFEEMRKDIKAVEKTIWKAAGGLAVLVFLAGFIWPIVKANFTEISAASKSSERPK